jgi:serine protease AprX
MSVAIPAPLVDFILLGPFDDRRQLQDSPILGDVWADFGARPDSRLSLLIAPYSGQSVSTRVSAVAKTIHDDLLDINVQKEARIACVHGFIAANLKFEEVLRCVVPLTSWWVKHFSERQTQPSRRSGKRLSAPEKKLSDLDIWRDIKLSEQLGEILENARTWHFKTGNAVMMRESLPEVRFVALSGLILWAAKQEPEAGLQSVDAKMNTLLKNPQQLAKEVEVELRKIADELPAGVKDTQRVYSVSRNRKAMPALQRSVAAVKGDATRLLFTVSCKEIGWAILDSGVDGSHPAFYDVHGNTRVKGAYDFSRFRNLMSLVNSDADERKKSAKEIAAAKYLKDERLKPRDIEKILKTLADGLENNEALRWDLVERLVEIKPETRPVLSHGTHVAGIIGASRKGAEAEIEKALMLKAKGKAAKEQASKDAKAAADKNVMDGMCPDINLYDFRVLAPDAEDTEFAIIAALQFIRYLNQRDTFMTIHGTNLSLSIPHNVRNYACGQTPICEECNRLSENGVVVVAAAGNHGHKTFATNDGEFEGYAAFSITDPGNAEDVITVGATHRFSPHMYGVSFFSSRGPTGDGRLKPDLVAPGEKIRAPLVGGDRSLGGNWGDLDGTSMAAPHVSGASAMLMARYSEFRGRPRRIKQILCETATDLGRERSFQGRGMLDVLRAFQFT